MKRALPILLCIFSFSAFAQTNIYLNIEHKLGDAPFALEQEAENNLGHRFELSRMEYYISEMVINHDDGQKTTIEDLWILVNATEPTSVDLGTYDINHIDKITFNVGVDEEHNHLDPATYPMDHPLAPKFPSMHWGWAFGYRFVALEGVAGVNLAQPLELHGLGDENYFKTEITLDANIGNGQFDLNLVADYAGILYDMDLNGGLIVHGSHAEAAQSLENMRDHVFTLGEIITNTSSLANIQSFDVFPNPSTDGQSFIHLDTDLAKAYQIRVVDGLGRTIQSFSTLQQSSIFPIELQQAGIYYVQLQENGQIITSKKLMIK